MITPAYAQMMARYNQWQNNNLYSASAKLDDALRRQETGVWFGSLFATLNHLVWADRYWMYRFTGSPKPEGGMAESRLVYDDFDELHKARKDLDQTILDWAAKLDPAWLAGEMSWFSGSKQTRVSQARALAVTHFFNHQTHHRGQIHALLTRFGTKPHDTDLIFMEPDHSGQA
jgi:uncharacterized damage-inducible protein DinB